MISHAEVKEEEVEPVPQIETELKEEKGGYEPDEEVKSGELGVQAEEEEAFSEGGEDFKTAKDQLSQPQRETASPAQIKATPKSTVSRAKKNGGASTGRSKKTPKGGESTSKRGKASAAQLSSVVKQFDS